jgi:hypothetical protein
MAAAAPAALDCWGALEEQALTEVVSTALGRPVRLAGFETTAVAYEPGSPATGALLRVAGATADGQPWSVFLKVLQHPRHWPRLGQLPVEIRQLFLDRFPWRGELVAWEPGFADRLPAGAWLRWYSRSRVELSGLPLLDRDEVWDHPLIAGAVDDRLRDDLRALGARVPELLDGMDRLPQAPPHGDASPQNLLVPADDPDTFVAIDAAFQSPQAVGFDLGQLLVGLTHAGQLPAAALPRFTRCSSRPSPTACWPTAAAPPLTRSPVAIWPAWPSGPASPRCRSSASRSHRPRPWPPPSVSAPP